MAGTPKLKCIVGLGNPGSRYAETRHNVGFRVVDAIAHRYQTRFVDEPKYKGEVALANTENGDVRLLKPMKFMNASGESVVAFLRFYKIAPENTLIIHDELDLAAGSARLKFGGGHGGHNGLRDIFEKTGSKSFLRLRLGIGHPGHADEVSSYVLGKPSPEDKSLIEEAIDRALNEITHLINGNVEAVMKILHTEAKS